MELARVEQTGFADTFEMKRAQAVNAQMKAMKSIFFRDWPGPTEDEITEHLRGFIQNISLNSEAATVAPNPSQRNILSNIIPAQVFGQVIVGSPSELWDPEAWNAEEKAVEGTKTYKFDVCGRTLKAAGSGIDNFLAGWHTIPLFLRFGNLESVDVWKCKATEAFRRFNDSDNIVYGHEQICSLNCCNHTFILLGMYGSMRDLLASMRIDASPMGFRRLDKCSEVYHQFGGAKSPHLVVSNQFSLRLILYLCTEEESIDKDTSTSTDAARAECERLMPTPMEVVEMDRQLKFGRVAGSGLASGNLAARALFRMGREDEAFELAKMIVAPNETIKKVSIVDCHTILGKISAKRGNLAEAGEHFQNAMSEAKISRLPMLEVFAARECKKHLLEPNGLDCRPIEEKIDEACMQMKKTRKDIAAIL